MNLRERYLAANLFGTPDKIPLAPGKGRKSTRERWYTEGLPRDVADITEFAYRQAGGTQLWETAGRGFDISQRQ